MGAHRSDRGQTPNGFGSSAIGVARVFTSCEKRQGAGAAMARDGEAMARSPNNEFVRVCVCACVYLFRESFTFSSIALSFFLCLYFFGCLCVCLFDCLSVSLNPSPCTGWHRAELLQRLQDLRELRPPPSNPPEWEWAGRAAASFLSRTLPRMEALLSTRRRAAKAADSTDGGGGAAA